MDIQVSTDTRLAYKAAGDTTTKLSSLSATYRSGEVVRLRFVNSAGAPFRLPEGSQVIFIVKPLDQYLAEVRAFSNAFVRPDAEDGWYQAMVPFTNELIGTDLNGATPDPSAKQKSSIDYMSQIVWIEPGQTQQSTPSIPTKIFNSLYAPGEPLPLGVGISASIPVVFAGMTGLQGGTPADLDAVGTARGQFPIGGIAQFVDSVRGLVSYQLRSGPAGPAAPASMAPLDYDPDTNDVSWWEV